VEIESYSFAMEKKVPRICNTMSDRIYTRVQQADGPQAPSTGEGSFLAGLTMRVVQELSISELWAHTTPESDPKLTQQLFGNHSEFDFGLIFAAPRDMPVETERTYATVAPLARDLGLEVNIKW
jgi:hypothetical protein